MSQNAPTHTPSPTSPRVGATPSGPKGDIPSTAGAGNTAVDSNTPENKQGAIDPSAPANTGITPGTAGEKGE